MVLALSTFPIFGLYHILVMEMVIKVVLIGSQAIYWVNSVALHPHLATDLPCSREPNDTRLLILFSRSVPAMVGKKWEGVYSNDDEKNGPLQAFDLFS